MIPIKRVDHISMGHANWKEQSERLEKLLGFKFLHNWNAKSDDDFSGCVSQVPGTGLEFEIISPGGPANFVQKFLDEGGPGLHHITVEVHDIEAAAQALKDMGLTPFGGVVNDGMWNLTYIHPKESGGILWQLFVPHKASPDVDRSTGHGAVNLQRVDHVSLACKDIEWQIEFQERVFGMEVRGRWTDDQLGYHGAVMSIPGSLLQFEMMQATRPDSFVQKFIDQRRPGMHHICCQVASVEGAVEGLRANGIEPWGGIIDSDWRRHTFLHPRDSGGVLFQLFEE